jgi:hypothetical protein
MRTPRTYILIAINDFKKSCKIGQLSLKYGYEITQAPFRADIVVADHWSSVMNALLMGKYVIFWNKSGLQFDLDRFKGRVLECIRYSHVKNAIRQRWQQ